MIAVDWGGSSARAYRLDAIGTIIAQRRSDRGVLSCAGEFSRVLSDLVQDWGDADIVLCGMIGSRSGWVEVPYLDCPAGSDELATALMRVDSPDFPGRALWFVPGLADLSSSDVPDVMRGEETSLCALLETLGSGNHVVCLPGTHSKWATLREGRIHGIATAMTGEAYALLRKHSILGKLMNDQDTRFDAYAFDAGLQRSGKAGGLLHHLFGVRTTGLFNQFSAAELPWYLSGLLIGHEIRASELLTRIPRPVQVHLVGNDRLLTAYARALVALGMGVQRHPEDLAAAGLHVLWRKHTRIG
jgi:2-dehydro-3-deoxygalactonokinase